MSEETPAQAVWVVDGYAARGAITEVDGRIKAAGKTTWVSHMAAAVLDGRTFMEQGTSRTAVVWLTEQTATTFRKVLERAGLTESDDLHVLHWHDVAGLRWPDVAKAAADKAEEVGAGLLVVDTLAQFAGIKGDGENAAGEALAAMRPLQEAAARGLAVLFCRHERKGGGEVGESGRGSSAFGGAVDVILSLRRVEGNVRPTVRVIESLSRFDETPDKLVVELSDRGGYHALGDSAAFAETEATSAIVDVLPTTAEKAATTAEVLDKLAERGVKRTTATEALARLADAGTVKRVGEGRRGDPYRYFRPVFEEKQDEEGSSEASADGTTRPILSSVTPTLGTEESKSTREGIHRDLEGLGRCAM